MRGNVVDLRGWRDHQGLLWSDCKLYRRRYRHADHRGRDSADWTSQTTWPSSPRWRLARSTQARGRARLGEFLPLLR